MKRGSWRYAALVLAPLVALAACEQIEEAVQRARSGPSVPGPAPLEDVPVAARAMAGSVLPQDQAAALLSPQPVLVVGGEVLVGARGEADVGRASAQARDVLMRLGLTAEVKPHEAGLLTVRFPFARGEPIEWNEADRCPVVVTQRQLENDVALATRCAVQRLRASRRFAFVEPNYIARAAQQDAPAASAGNGLPDDPLYPLQWHLHERGAEAGRSPGGGGFEAFWRAGRVGARVVRVALLDSGLDLQHPDLRHAANVGAGVDLISDPRRAGDGDGPDADVQDASGGCAADGEEGFHGARIAGVIGAGPTNDRNGVAGGAWNVTLQPVRVLGQCGGELADIVAGLRWAAGLASVTFADGSSSAAGRAADIITLPFSIQAPCPASLQAAIDAAVARNAVIVTAAGNKANRTALFAPANCANVITVAAADARGELAFYSNFGPEVDVLAPGGDMFADTDGDGRPDGVLTLGATQSGCYDPLTQNSEPRCDYVFAQGASFAAAHVSAALALLASQSGARGRALEQALFEEAVSPLPAGFGDIECARSRNAIPTGPGSSACTRPAGRGALDLGRAIRRP